MRELALLTFLSLDGVLQAPSAPDEDRSGGFDRGGWAQPWWDEVMEQVRAVAMSEPYDFLFGRRTYDLFATHWPTVGDDDPVARRMNAATKVVVTSSESGLEWANSRAVAADAGRIAALKREEGPLLQVHGSGQLARFLLAEGLVDELRLWTFPVVVGAGARLFDVGALPGEWRLVAQDRTPNGAAMTIYRSAPAR